MTNDLFDLFPLKIHKSQVKNRLFYFFEYEFRTFVLFNN